MVTIYRDYADEPDPVFLTLSEHLACELYHLEMDGFEEDIPFYRHFLPRSGKILEIGCGTGRIARQLAIGDRRIFGIDISLVMLDLAVSHHSARCRFLCMDMVDLGFREAFDTIIIPYNTLNLLPEEDRIRRCLEGCRRAIQPAGQLLVQLYVPAPTLPGKTTFQFQMFDRPGGGRIIKEIIKRPQPESQTIEIEERFRIRPMQPGVANEDYRSVYRIAAFPLDRWLTLFADAGFFPREIRDSYSGSTCNNPTSSLRLLKLKKI